MDVTQQPKVATALSDWKTHDASPVGQAPLGSKGAGVLASLGPAALVDNLQGAARTHLEQVLRLDPTAVRPRVLLFLLELRDGRFAQAEPLVVDLLRQDPREPDYLAMYAELKLRTAELPRSRELCTQALEREPKHVEALRVKVLLDIAQGEPHDERGLARVFEHTANAQEYGLALFHSLVERQHFDAATRLGREVLRLQPDNATLAAALVDLRILTHPLGLPLSALRKAGWLACSVAGLVAIATYKALTAVSETLAAGFLVMCLCVPLYAWVYPAFMRRWFQAQE